MSLVRSRVGGMAISGLKESAYNTSAAVTHFLNSRNPRGKQNYRNYSDAGEARGTEEMTTWTRLAAMPTCPIDVPADDISTPLLLAYALGTDVASAPAGTPGSNQKKHTITVASTTTELNSTTVQYNLSNLTSTSATDQKAQGFSGAVVQTLTYSGDASSGECKLSGRFAASGSLVTPINISGLTKPIYGPTPFNNTFLRIGTAFTPGHVEPAAIVPTFAELASNGIDWTPYILGWAWTIDNKIDENAGHAGSLGLNATSMYRGNREMKLALTLRLDDAVASLAALRDPSSNTLNNNSTTAYPCLQLCTWTNVAIDSAASTVYNYATSISFPLVTVESTEIVEQGGLTVANVNLTVGKNTTQNSVYVTSWNRNNVNYAG